MKFEERSYSSKTYRPRPEIYIDEPSRLLIVATPWGARGVAKKAIERMTDYLSLAREDAESTSPFERLSCLSTQANNLRIAALLANEAIYREENKSEYRSGVELFAATIDEQEFVFVQAGQPQVLLARAQRSLVPLGSQIDLAFDMSENELLPPLPSQLLGLDTTINLNLNSFRVHPGDQVVLLSHSHLPESLFSMKNSEIDVEQVSRALAKNDQDLAFWIGILQLGEMNQMQSQDGLAEPLAGEIADRMTDMEKEAI